jgi:hypothetical protein
MITRPARKRTSRMKYDLFVNHAYADKRTLVTRLVRELQRHIKVWYDDDVVKGGDPQLRVINQGMRQSRRAIVVFSKEFLKTKTGVRHHEYQVLLSIEISRRRQNLIIPVLYGVTHEQVASHYPDLAGKYQLDFKKLRFNGLVNEILRAVKPQVQPRPEDTVTFVDDKASENQK